LSENIKEDIKEELKEELKEEEVKEETPKTKKEKKDKYKEQIAKLEAELSNQKNEYLKVFAEMENTKKRLKEESIKDRKYSSQKVVGELINPIDMLVKIVNSPAPTPEIANYLIGFKMLANQMIDILKAEGLAEIESVVGKEFDPTVMQAMSVEENDELEENTIVRVMQTGYMYKDRVLRPAMVIVSKKKIEEKKEEE